MGDIVVCIYAHVLMCLQCSAIVSETDLIMSGVKLINLKQQSITEREENDKTSQQTVCALLSKLWNEKNGM